jgi:alginate O-acetyltransferase complex protein AlgI
MAQQPVCDKLRANLIEIAWPAAGWLSAGLSMLFNSYEFIFGFFPLVFLGFLILARTRIPSLVQAWLVICSLFFYGWWNYKYLALILVSILCNYFVGLLISHSKNHTRRLWLILGLCFNLGLLGFFKYADFFISTTNIFFETDFNLLHIILPLAISFFTFQQIAYLVDRYQDIEFKREISFLEYMLFVAFFPQLLAGPIVHHSQVIPQFRHPEFGRFKLDNLSIGLTIFFFGLFKKVIIADRLGEWATPAFAMVDGGGVLSTQEAWLGAMTYTFQLYFDFSGYSDMAIGLGCIFGIRLPANFFSPYKADSIIEFWRRWHMTLSQFLRDHLYIPLGGNRKGKPRRYVNLMITMLLGGLWHGSSWTFVVWGGLHGAYLGINHAWRAFKQHYGLQLLPPRIARPVAVLLTFAACLAAIVFFRAETLSGALAMSQSMAGMLPVGLDHQALYKHPDKIFRWVVGGCLVVWFMPNVMQIFDRVKPTIDKLPEYKGRIIWSPNIFWLIILLLVMYETVGSLSTISEFVYFQF